jgi:hypothetical protein
MTEQFGMLDVMRRSGTERFRAGSKEVDFDLLSFWQWSCSDLLSNATRGIVAEFLVAQALEIADEVREEWAAYDLKTKEGITIEVKSAAYCQRWYQDKVSRISFVVPKTRAWDPATNRLSAEPARSTFLRCWLIRTSRRWTHWIWSNGCSMCCRPQCWMRGFPVSTRSLYLHSSS